MEEVVHWFSSKGFILVHTSNGHFLVKNRLSLPYELAKEANEESRWKFLWAADNWIALALNEEKEICFQIDNFFLDVEFVLNSPIEAVENIYFQNPDIKVH